MGGQGHFLEMQNDHIHTQVVYVYGTQKLSTILKTINWIKLNLTPDQNKTVFSDIKYLLQNKYPNEKNDDDDDDENVLINVEITVIR